MKYLSLILHFTIVGFFKVQSSYFSVFQTFLKRSTCAVRVFHCEN